jgi:hypothetical protein
MQLKDPLMDCPNDFCEGWLILWGTLDGDPVYFVCSNKDNMHKPCLHKTVFSTRSSKCVSCEAEIEVKDIITLNREHHWVHFACALGLRPPGVYAYCLRCSEIIATELDAVESTSGTTTGFIHVRCGKRANKRARFTPPDEEGVTSSEEVSSSQESNCLLFEQM